MVDFTDGIESGELDSIVSANEGSVDVNQGSPTRETIEQPKVLKDTQVADPNAVAPKNLRDQISSALKGETEEPVGDPAKPGAQRGPDGKFIKAEAAVDPLAAPVVDPNAPAAVQPITPPVQLTPEEREAFTKLPVELQTSVARTLSSIGEREARVKGLEQVDMLIAPRRRAWALNGMTEAQAMNQLLALSDFATQKPADFIKYFASQNGVDLEDVVFGSDPVDPQYQALQDELNSVKSQLTGMTTAQTQQAHQARVNDIIDFALEKDAGGTLVRPHFEEIGESIYPFIQAHQARNPNMPLAQLLQESYEAACWANPTIRAKLTAVNTAASDAARIQEQQDKVARARNAGSSLNGGVPNNNGTSIIPANRSLRDEIRANLNS